VIESPVPEGSRIRRTFTAEAFRAAAAGAIETAFATFAILIVVTRFESGPAIKALLLASPAFGLLGGLIIVPAVARLGLRASHAAGFISLISMVGFAIAAIGAANETTFVVGMCLGLGVMGMSLPLQTQYLRSNYPGNRRGRLFSATIVIRALSAMLVSWGFGIYLDRDLSRYPVLLWVFVAAAAVSALCFFLIPSDALRKSDSGRIDFTSAVRLSLKDSVFVRILIAVMCLGIGVMSANALRVDYLVNPEHGLMFDVMTVSLITGIVPSLMRLISTFFWGWLFDRIDFFLLRIIVNLIFLAGVILYFVWTDVRIILIGSALFGLARGGGEILFNLFVTKITAAENIADYMSVHTFLAGIRLFLAPFLGFFLVKYADIDAMVVLSSVLAIVSVFLVRGAAPKRAGVLND